MRLAVVAERGQAMADAADLEPSGMSALLGASLEQAEEVSARRRAEGGRLTVANVNAPGQVVVAGGKEDLDWLEAEAPALGLRKVVRLKVAGAFHSPFMEPAAARSRRGAGGGPLPLPDLSSVVERDRPALAGRQGAFHSWSTRWCRPFSSAQTLEGMAGVGGGPLSSISAPATSRLPWPGGSAPEPEQWPFPILPESRPGLEAVGTIASPQPGS